MGIKSALNQPVVPSSWLAHCAMC